MDWNRNLETIDGWLNEQVDLADNARRESRQIARRSYGAGYDQGRYDGLREALAKMVELWEEGPRRS
jgi:hypothetical protein